MEYCIHAISVNHIYTQLICNGCMTFSWYFLSYLQHFDVLWGDKKRHSDADKGQADESEAGDDDTSGQDGLPGWKSLLCERGVIWPIGHRPLCLHPDTVWKKESIIVFWAINIRLQNLLRAFRKQIIQKLLPCLVAVWIHRSENYRMNTNRKGSKVLLQYAFKNTFKVFFFISSLRNVLMFQ